MSNCFTCHIFLEVVKTQDLLSRICQIAGDNTLLDSWDGSLGDHFEVHNCQKHDTWINLLCT
jgi:hypothetical protein